MAETIQTNQILIIRILAALFLYVSLWKIFKKADRPGWAALVPVYNFYTYVRVMGFSGWTTIILLIPFFKAPIILDLLAAFFFVYLNYRLAKSFNRGPLFTMGTIVLFPLFILILAFDNSEYESLES